MYYGTNFKSCWKLPAIQRSLLHALILSLCKSFIKSLYPQTRTGPWTPDPQIRFNWLCTCDGFIIHCHGKGPYWLAGLKQYNKYNNIPFPPLRCLRHGGIETKSIFHPGSDTITTDNRNRRAIRLLSGSYRNYVCVPLRHTIIRK